MKGAKQSPPDWPAAVRPQGSAWRFSGLSKSTSSAAFFRGALPSVLWLHAHPPLPAGWDHRRADACWDREGAQDAALGSPAGTRCSGPSLQPGCLRWAGTDVWSRTLWTVSKVMARSTSGQILKRSEASTRLRGESRGWGVLRGGSEGHQLVSSRGQGGAERHSEQTDLRNLCRERDIPGSWPPPPRGQWGEAGRWEARLCSKGQGDLVQLGEALGNQQTRKARGEARLPLVPVLGSGHLLQACEFPEAQTTSYTVFSTSLMPITL